MNYIEIQPTSLVNGEGIRVVLWVAGCNHHCKGCHNPDTWDADSGKPWTTAAQEKLFYLASTPYRDGITLSGGDPMYPANRFAILSLCKAFRHRFRQDKTIWMYTGYTFEEIRNEPVLEYLDVIVDGPYIESQRSPTRQWVGSENQRVWRKTKGTWIMEEPKYAEHM